MRRLTLLLPIVLLCLLAACTAAVSEPPAGPTPETRPDEPPPSGPPGVPAALLNGASGESQRGVIGNHCWNLGAGAIECIEASGPFAPLDPLRVAPGEALTFTLPSVPLASLSLRVTPWAAGDGSAPAGLARVAPDTQASPTPIEPAAPLPWQAPAAPGEYLVELFTVYENGGDIHYSWHLLVE